ncbi:hypothetical protein BGW80DRAFT_1297042 [Lactifluus volemus]|nr:hypothetical protein BGW80DRAFT_1297042 [Lactifluus volemus]
MFFKFLAALLVPVVASAGPVRRLTPQPASNLNSITALVSLNITNGPITHGTLLKFSSSAINSTRNSSNFSCLLLDHDVRKSVILPLHNCTVPRNFDGLVIAFITLKTSNSTTKEESPARLIAAGPAEFIISGNQSTSLPSSRVGGSAPPATPYPHVTTTSPGASSSATVAGYGF